MTTHETIHLGMRAWYCPAATPVASGPAGTKVYARGVHRLLGPVGLKSLVRHGTVDSSRFTAHEMIEIGYAVHRLRTSNLRSRR